MAVVINGNGAVTGVTSQDELNVDSNTLVVDSTNNRVGIGTSSPDESLHLHSSAITRLKITGSSGEGEDNGIKIYQNGVNTTIANGDNGYMRFYTNNTERMRILSGGGLTFNGDTDTANALNDYEEGTWTCNLTTDGGSVTMSDNTASYTKIGNVVYIQGRISLSAISSPTGTWYIDLPFANISSSDVKYAGVIPVSTTGIYTTRIVMQIVAEGSGVSKFYTRSYESGRSWDIGTGDDLLSYSILQFGGHYFTD